MLIRTKLRQLIVGFSPSQILPFRNILILFFFHLNHLLGWGFVEVAGVHKYAGLGGVYLAALDDHVAQDGKPQNG